MHQVQPFIFLTIIVEAVSFSHIAVHTAFQNALMAFQQKMLWNFFIVKAKEIGLSNEISDRTL